MTTATQIRVHTGDEGFVFGMALQEILPDGSLGDAIDLSAATTKELVFVAPSGTTKRVTADNGTFDLEGVPAVGDGSDGRIQHTSDADHYDEEGLWRVQAYVVLDGAGFSSTAISLRVGQGVAP